MGRRRERRQGVSRRVKIDLSIDEEPRSPLHPENTAGHTVNGEAGEDNEDQVKSAGHTSPPSKSGLQANPLSLLGQYNDDEIEDEGTTESNLSVKTHIQMDAQVADFIADLETSGLLDAQDDNATDKENEGNEFNATIPEKEESFIGSNAEPRSHLPSVPVVGNSVQEPALENDEEKYKWKAILHEESGEYYYWNTETGATAWEKPDFYVEGEAGYSVPPIPSEEYAKTEYRTDYEGLQESYAAADTIHSVVEVPGVNYCGLVNMGCTIAEYSDTGSADIVYSSLAHSNSIPETSEAGVLMQMGETILNRFKLLAGDALLSVPARVRLAIEAEIRLSDCRLLASQGCTEGLFWSHTEAQIKRLESVVALDEAAVMTDMEQKQTLNAAETSNRDSLASRHLDEDVAMEVDMDIDDDGGTGIDPGGSSHDASCEEDQRAVPTFTPVIETEPSDHRIWLPPPPPDDDWAPPPPPEPEMVPPPPPEEPPPLPSSSGSDSTYNPTTSHSNGHGDSSSINQQPMLSIGDTSTATSNGHTTSTAAGVTCPVPVSTGIAEAVAAAAKKATKVTRTKKKNTATVPLKANKKVSSLVNKWMAAKEELHESEDEDEKALYDPGALERKRQREIEDWRREQIASGHALDNANFQPLGPLDWRERVKKAKKDEDKSRKSTGKKKLNLELLSKDLAPGWKAYWDESSGDVYYGNLTTKETTWDRPAA